MCTPLAAAFLRITALGLKGMVDVGTSKPPILWLLYYYSSTSYRGLCSSYRGL
jgi:hypothetical protein